MPEPTDTADFFRPRLAEMIDLRHPLAVLASRLAWPQIEAALAPYFARRVRAGRVLEHDDLFGPSLQVAGAGVAAAGRPRLPLRLMASLLYLKHALKLSDEELVERWAEHVVWQFFSGMTFFEPRLPCDATQIGRFRSALGEAGVEELLKATIDTAVASKAIKPAEFERVIVDTTVQEKAIAHPVYSRLLEIARAKVVAAARRAGIALKQTVAREGSHLRRRAGGYAHAKQFKRLQGVLKRQRTVLGIVLREVQRKLGALPGASVHAVDRLRELMGRAERIRTQRPRDKNKLYALHAPEAECIGKGKARRPYEFGVKVSVAVTHKQGLVVGARTPIDSCLRKVLPVRLVKVAMAGHQVEEAVAIDVDQFRREHAVASQAGGDARGFGRHVPGAVIDEEERALVVARGRLPAVAAHENVDGPVVVDVVLRARHTRSGALKPARIASIHRRSAIEPAIGHMKMNGRLRRSPLKGALDDALPAVMCGAAHNLRLLWRSCGLLLGNRLPAVGACRRQSSPT